MTDFISREQVLELLQRRGGGAFCEAIAALPCFPAPNPEQRDGRNIMGQTEAEFWAAADARPEQGI